MHPIVCTSQDELQFFSWTNLACSMLSSVPVDASNCAKLIHTWKEKWGNREMKASHSSPQLPPRSSQYSRWRLNAGEFITGLFSVCSWEYTFIETLLHKYTLLCEIKKKYMRQIWREAQISPSEYLEDSRSAPSIHRRGGFLQSVFSFGLAFERSFKGASRKLQTLAKS